ncbi:MAG: TIGR04086 family membrane protein [Ruminococcus sp.]|nr:TIGR04086 family membrane protein [Ruminococcus sp.]
MKRDWSKEKNLLVCVLLSYVITIVFLMLLALFLYCFQWNLDKVTLGIIVIYIVSCLFGGWMAGRKMKKQKFLWGLLTGVVYFLILVLISMLSKAGIQGQGIEIAAIAIMCMGAGMLGGMVS